MRGKRSRMELLQTEDSEPALEPLSPTGGSLTPEPRPKYHDDWCNCESCLDIRAAVENYVTAKKLFDQNGF